MVVQSIDIHRTAGDGILLPIVSQKKPVDTLCVLHKNAGPGGIWWVHHHINRGRGIAHAGPFNTMLLM